MFSLGNCNCSAVPLVKNQALSDTAHTAATQQQHLCYVPTKKKKHYSNVVAMFTDVTQKT